MSHKVLSTSKVAILVNCAMLGLEQGKGAVQDRSHKLGTLKST